MRLNSYLAVLREFDDEVSVGEGLVAGDDSRDFIFNSFSVDGVNEYLEESALAIGVSDSLANDGGGVEEVFQVSVVDGGEGFISGNLGASELSEELTVNLLSVGNDHNGGGEVVFQLLDDVGVDVVEVLDGRLVDLNEVASLISYGDFVGVFNF